MVCFLCPVRGCRRPLVRAGRRLACARRHSFDLARSGYLNLLGAQDRRAARPGDTAETLAARRRVLAGGFETPLTDAIVGLVPLAPEDAVLDVGCGEGQQLAAAVARFGCEGHGLDISVAAIQRAARAHPGLHWVVANADRFLPYADASFRLVQSITGRKNAGEFRRVLRDDGALLVVVPGADDLVELREAVLGARLLRDRVGATVEAFTPLFTLARHERIRRVVRLDPGAIRDAMAGSYRGLRASQRSRLMGLTTLDVTLSRDALLFRP